MNETTISGGLEIPAAIDPPHVDPAAPVQLPIPDRVSADPRNEFYWPDYLSLGIKLNGIERQGDVNEFCVSEGWMKVRVRRAGRWVMTPGGGYYLRTLKGDVKPFYKERSRALLFVHDDAAHMSAAEAKRARKAAKRAKDFKATENNEHA